MGRAPNTYVWHASAHPSWSGLAYQSNRSRLRQAKPIPSQLTAGQTLSNSMSTFCLLQPLAEEVGVDKTWKPRLVSCTSWLFTPARVHPTCSFSCSSCPPGSSLASSASIPSISFESLYPLPTLSANGRRSQLSILRADSTPPLLSSALLLPLRHALSSFPYLFFHLRLVSFAL